MVIHRRYFSDFRPELCSRYLSGFCSNFKLTQAMTHQTHTEQERAEFEAWAFREKFVIDFDEEIQQYELTATRLAWKAWQAARRAQVVPKGWKLVPVELLERATESLGSFVSDHGWGQADMDTFDDLSALAAAPQPPEADSNSPEFEGIKPEAAPVQMPEPVAYVHVPSLAWGGKVRPGVSFEKYEDDHKDGVYALRTPLYTENQVRQLLAAHGVK